MKILTPGHKYELSNFEQNDQKGQEIQFIEKESANDGKGTLNTVSDGTTNEDVLAMLIDRMQYLQSKFPCRENAIVITKLEESLMWLEKRTRDRVVEETLMWLEKRKRDRVARNVEGKHLS